MRSLLEVSGVSVTFDGFRAINNLSFQIGEPELRAVIGPNGAGKTTFMDIVTGKTRPDEGKVLWGETSVSLLGMSEAQIARAGIGRKFQRPTVFEDQTVADNLMVALKKDRGPFQVLFFRPSPADQPSSYSPGAGSCTVPLPLASRVRYEVRRGGCRLCSDARKGSASGSDSASPQSTG